MSCLLLGAKKAVEMFADHGFPYTGLQHFLLAKLCLRELLDQHGITEQEAGGKEEEEEEEKEEGVKEREEEGEKKEGEEEREGVPEKGVLKFEDLGPTLELCHESLQHSLEYGARAYYFVNGKLLALVMRNAMFILFLVVWQLMHVCCTPFAGLVGTVLTDDRAAGS